MLTNEDIYRINTNTHLHISWISYDGISISCYPRKRVSAAAQHPIVTEMLHNSGLIYDGVIWTIDSDINHGTLNIELKCQGILTTPSVKEFLLALDSYFALLGDA